MADIAAVAHVLTSSADGNNIVGRGDVLYRPLCPRRCSKAPLVLLPRAQGLRWPYCCHQQCWQKALGTPFAVLSSPSVLPPRASTPVAVLTLPVVLLTSAFTHRDGVTEACSIVVERERAGNRVVVNQWSLLESASAPVAVLSVTGGIATQRKLTVGSVSDASRVVTEGRRPDGGVEAASGVANEAQTLRWPCFGGQSCCWREPWNRWLC